MGKFNPFLVLLLLLLALETIPSLNASGVNEWKGIDKSNPKDAKFEELLSAPQPPDKPSQIPKIVHFIFGMKAPNPPFEIEHYLSLKSAHISIKPEVIYFWYHFEPVGDLWDAVKPFVVMKHIEIITSVYGNPINHFAHMADVIRLMVLFDYGGIYLDIDVVSLKPFDDLLSYDMVLGREGKGNAVGLCNAVILSRPRSSFLQRWMASYKNFDGEIWNYHSVQLPAKMAQEYSDEVTIVDYDAFFWPLWNSDGMQTMFMRKDYDYANNYAVHLWESNAKEWFLSKTTLTTINEIDNSIFCQVRKFIKAGYDRELDPNCQILSKSIYKDGTIGVWNFDSDTDLKVVDYLGNHLNGWALNGTRLRQDANTHAIFREFNGEGDFVILPTLKSQTLAEVTIAMRFKTPRTCKHRRILAALQHPIGYSMVIETDCVSRQKIGEVLEIRVLQTESRLGITSYNLKPWLHYLNNGKWHHVAVVLSLSLGKMILYLDGEAVGDASWPMGNDLQQQLKNVWIAAQPPPSIRTMARPTESDFKGYMDDIVITQSALPAESIKAIMQNTASFFSRHKLKNDYQKHQNLKNGMRILKYNFASDKPLTDLTGNSLDAELEGLGNDFDGGFIIQSENRIKLPIFKHEINVLPDTFTVTYIVSSLMENRPKDGFLYWSKFVTTTLCYGVGIDTATGHLQVRNINQPWIKNFMTVRQDGPCPLAHKANYLITITVDMLHSRMVFMCNGVLIGDVPSPITTMEEITDFELSGNGGKFLITYFDFYVGALDLASSVSLASEYKIIPPSLTVKVNGTFVADFSSLTLEERVQPYLINQMQDDYSLLEIEIDDESHISKIYPVMTASKTVVIPETVVVGHKSVLKFDYRCFKSGEILVSMVLPDIWASFQWKYNCELTPSPVDMIKLVDAHIQPQREDSVKSRYLTTFDEVTHEYPPLPEPVPENFSFDEAVFLSFLFSTAFIALLTAIKRMTRRRASGMKHRTTTLNLFFIMTSTFLIVFGYNTDFAQNLIKKVDNLYKEAPSATNVAKTTSSSSSSLALSSVNNYGQGTKTLNPTFYNLLFNVTYASDLEPPPKFSPKVPFFSIVTPCYNQTEFLQETATSVLQQTYPYWEWLIIRDGGDENCLLEAKAIQAKYPGYLIRVFDKKNTGLADTRNFGIEKSYGDWICLLDADDTLHYVYLEATAALLKKNRRITAVNSNQQFFGESSWRWDLPAFSAPRMRYQGLFPVQTIFRKWDWARVDGFEPTLPWGNEDWSYWISLSHLSDFKVYRFNDYLLNYRYKKVSMQRKKEIYEKDVNSLLMTLHPEKYTAGELLDAHRLIMKFINDQTKDQIKLFIEMFPKRVAPMLWLGLFSEEQKSFEEAAKYYDISMKNFKRIPNWQPLYRKILISPYLKLSKAEVEDMVAVVLQMKPDLEDEDSFIEFRRKLGL